MDARMFAGGSVKRFQFLFWGLFFSIFTAQFAQAAPVVVSVDHRVTVSYSKPQFDARKGILTVQARIKNRSEAALLSPLQLSFDQAVLKNLRIQNAQGVGKDGRPYFDIKLPKGMLLAKSSTDAIKVVIAVERKGNSAKHGNDKTALAILNRAQRVSAGVEMAFLNLSATPYALGANTGKQSVRFSVPVRLSSAKIRPVNVYVRLKGDKRHFVMNDLGKNGDFAAKDGIFGVNVQIDTRKYKADSCLLFEAFTNEGRYESVSPSLQLCVSSFPVRTAVPNTSKPAVFPNGMKAVADEILLFAKPSTSAAAIRELARSINASVVGSILPLNLYQLRLPAPTNSGRLTEIVARLSGRSGVTGVSVNAIGAPAGHVTDVTDPEFANQHGVKLVAKHPTLANTYIWDANAIGSGVTIVVADEGLDRTHPEFGTPGSCQVTNNECGPAALNNDNSTPGAAQWHGTRVAGVIVSKALNSQGIAGVAHGGIVHSYKVASYALSEMDAIFMDVAGYVASDGTASVINASFTGGPYTGAITAPAVAALCQAINTAVTSGFGAIVVNAAGNNNDDNFYYPARCNEHLNLLEANRGRLISVGNSASIVTRRCGNVGIDQRCQTDLDDATKLGSNYGAWVEIAAPGSDIRTTIPGGYAYATGTSFSAPIVSGAVAILKSCGVPLDSIQSTLTGSATVTVPYPGSIPATETPRLDIYRALQSQVPTAPNLSAAESYTENVPLNLTNIVIASNLSGCATFTATLTLSDIAAGSLTTGTSGSVTSTFVGGVWTASGPMADVNALLAGVTFNPSPDYSSNFNIATSITDGITTITGSKAMTGIAVNSPPVNTVPAPQAATEDIVKVVGGISVADADAGAANIDMTLTATNGTISVNPAVAGGAPSIVGNGTASITLTGSQGQINTTLADAASVAYLPTSNFNGAATLTVATDDNGASGGPVQSDTDVINISVASVNDPPETLAGSGNGTEDVSPILVSLSGSDIDGTVASFNIASGPSNGTLYSDAAMTLPLGGSVAAVGNAATVYYKPNLNFNGNDTFTYASVDNLGLADASAATATVTVVAANDPPETLAGSGNGTEDVSPILVSLSGSDIDGTVASFNIGSGPSNGTLYSDAAMTLPLGGSVAAVGNAATVYYKPALNFNGPDSFTYASVDNLGLVDASAATATIAVIAANDPPETAAGSGNGTEDVSPILVSLSGSDIDGTVASFNIGSGPSNGTLYSDAAMTLPLGGSVAAVGNAATVYYQPNLNFNGTDTFTYASVDNLGLADAAAATATITVVAANDPLTGSPSINPPDPTPAQRHVGDYLTAITAGMADADCPAPVGNNPGSSTGLCTTGQCDFAYQWRSSTGFGVPGDDIPPGSPPVSTTNSDYTLRASEVDRFMSVCVSTGMGADCSIRCTANDATAVGDPHIFTVDGLRYDFQGAGEFVALRSANGMEIQLRMEAVSTAPPLPDDYTGLTSGVSVNTAVAARVGKHRLSYQPDTSPNAAAGTFVLRVDGAVKALPVAGIDLGDGGRVLPLASGGIQIDFPDQTTLMVNTSSWPFYGAHWLHVNVFHTPAYEGLMGARSKGSWLPRLSDGSAFGAKPASLHDRYVELYEKFADSWRVNKDTSLFDYVDGTSTATYANKKWPTENGPYAAANVPVAQPLPLKVANLACRDIAGKIEKANCVFDVRVMGHKDLAKGHLLNQKIRLGAVNVVVRPAGKLNARGEMVVTATVVRHATVVPKVKGVRTVPAGTIQFMFGDKPLGKPVRLDGKGQAKLVVTRQNLERFNAGKLAITAHYLPTRDKGNVFLPGISRKLTGKLVAVDPKIRGVR